ncbi:MAG: hypothetical protein DHS20C20_20460 [Ardenticatenaceae bacterium]|nr:MAG: hypothetical protein DHS20C20_20460 [Ardenticatenaceae bacterium]
MLRLLKRRTNFPTLRFFIPEVLKTMPDEFDSHQFIAAFAYQNQWEYVHELWNGRAEFQTINDAIIHWLRESGLVQQIGTRNSENMFKQVYPAAVWRKVA